VIFEDVGNRHHAIPAQLRIWRECPFLETDQASAAGAYPKTSVAANVEVGYVVLRNLRITLGVVNYEAHSVEASQTFLRRQPQIAVGSLRKGLDRFLGKAVGSVPNIVDIGGERKV
jgi:hypothetical protein